MNIYGVFIGLNIQSQVYNKKAVEGQTKRHWRSSKHISTTKHAVLDTFGQNLELIWQLPHHKS